METNSRVWRRLLRGFRLRSSQHVHSYFISPPCLCLLLFFYSGRLGGNKLLEWVTPQMIITLKHKHTGVMSSWHITSVLQWTAAASHTWTFTHPPVSLRFDQVSVAIEHHRPGTSSQKELNVPNFRQLWRGLSLLSCVGHLSLDLPPQTPSTLIGYESNRSSLSQVQVQVQCK